MRWRVLLKLLGPVTAAGLIAIPPGAAQGRIAAATTSAQVLEAEPAVANYAWYWEEQQQQKITDPTSGADIATIELPNPYCPGQTPLGSPPEQTCREGRLPVEVKDADYDKPNKKSALAFDLTVVPPGSKVYEFKLTLLEANDPQSQPVNIESHKVKACLVTEVFGDGEARVVKEAPKVKCSGDVAVGTRKEFTTKGATDQEETRHRWVFDLTGYAKDWVAKGQFFTAIMLQPEKPRGEVQPEDSRWSVVFTGPIEKNGITSVLKYKPSKMPPPPPPPPPPPAPVPPDPGSSGTTTTTVGSATDTTGTAAPTTETGGTGPAAPPAQAVAPEPPNDGTGARVPGIPAYVWLALLVAFVAFSLVRSIVLESATGIRPDGVLAQIRKLNAEKRGVAAGPDMAVDSRSPLATLGAGFRAIGETVQSFARRLSFSRRG